MAKTLTDLATDSQANLTDAIAAKRRVNTLEAVVVTQNQQINSLTAQLQQQGGQDQNTLDQIAAAQNEINAHLKAIAPEQPESDDPAPAPAEASA